MSSLFFAALIFLLFQKNTYDDALERKERERERERGREREKGGREGAREKEAARSMTTYKGEEA